MKLDCSSFADALGQLKKSYGFLHSHWSQERPDFREQFRAATIQAFEFTYELAVKMIRRQLAQISANPGHLQELDFADLMREAANAGIVREALPYVGYREMRNKTSHGYNAEQAEAAVAQIDGFLRDMDFLLNQLQERNRASD